MQNRYIVPFLTVVLMAGCGVRLSRMNDQDKAERLATERGRLQELTNPVEKTRSHILISAILLDFAGAAMAENNLDGMRTLLNQYVTTITAARDVMTDSDRDAERNPAGYKDLEVSLRQQIRYLQEMARSVAFDDRAPVEAALNRAETIRDEMIRKIFPRQPSTPAHFSTAERSRSFAIL
jgi:hypothetical protein